MKTQVVVVDDSPFFREVLRELLEADRDIQVAGQAGTGEAAIDLVHALAPDLVTLDIRMPGLGGLETIAQIMARRPVPVLVITGQPAGAGSELVFEAVRRGALDILEKGMVTAGNVGGETLRNLVRQLARVRVVRHVAQPRSVPSFRLAGVESAWAPPQTRPSSAPKTSAVSPRTLGALPGGRCRVIGLAASAGGPAAIVSVLEKLPDDFCACIAVVQHLPCGFTASFAQFLQAHTRLEVSIAKAGSPPRPRSVVVAAEEQHLELGRDRLWSYSKAPAVANHRPSATVLLRSLAYAAGAEAIGIILTGMGDDGVAGLLELRRAGALTLAQDEASSAVFGMPDAAAKAGAAAKVLPLGDIANALIETVGTAP